MVQPEPGDEGKQEGTWAQAFMGHKTVTCDLGHVTYPSAKEKLLGSTH